ncbi:CHAT domain-containing protein, partial [candidate division KSB1 bacterium]|nr:CHAT domain-containing protein [candidate division KSB1 bacterium]
YYTQMSRDRELKDRIFTTGQNNKNAPFTDENFLKADLALRKKQYQIRKNSYTAEIDWERQASELEAAKYTLITQRIKSFESLQSELNLVKSHIPTLKEIEKQLEKNGRGMLIYHFSEDMSFVFAVTGDSCKVVKLDVELDTLSATIDRMMTPFHNVQQDFIQDIPFKADIAYKLYTWLFEPIQNSIRLPNQLLILPDNAIINLPFELLLTQKPAKTHYSPSDKPTYVENFLVHQYSFVYNPTLTNPPQKRYNMSNKPNLLVYANPFYMPRMDIHPLLSLRQFSGWRFDPLPFAELEAERIKQYYPHTKIIKREQALETRFKEEADRYEIIHLATHAFVDSTFDAFSGLAFSLGADSTDDGLLMGYEISDLDLSCDLVTLSACETGRGKLMEGEGVLGLPRQFLAAGSKSVLMTLWKVDDKFTSQLMPEFYDFYLNKKMSKADALENAKHNMLSLKPSSQGIYYQHPFYWASFVLYGDPGDRKPSMNMVFTLVSLSVVMGISFFFQFNIYTRKQKS